MPQVLGPAGAAPPPTRNEVLLREAVDRLRLQLDAAREVSVELEPILQWMRPLHGRFDHAEESPCGWCRLIAAYDKFTDYDKARGGS